MYKLISKASKRMAFLLAMQRDSVIMSLTKIGLYDHDDRLIVGLKWSEWLEFGDKSNYKNNIIVNCTEFTDFNYLF